MVLIKMGGQLDFMETMKNSDLMEAFIMMEKQNYKTNGVWMQRLGVYIILLEKS